MKIGIEFSYNFKDPSINREMFFKIKEAGFSAIDFDMCNVETDFYKLEDKKLKELLSKIKNEISEAGLFINQTHGPWMCPPVCDYSKESRIKRLAEMKKSIEITAFLGTKYFVIHPLMPFGCDMVPIETEKEAFEINKAFFLELTSFAERKNVIITFENMPFTTLPMSPPHKILEFIKAIDSDYFKMCLDTGHANCVMEGDIYSNVKAMGNELKVLHVHDNDGKGDFHKFPYDGNFNWQEFMKALKEINYEGVFSLETKPKSAFGTKEYNEELTKLYNIAKKLTE